MVLNANELSQLRDALQDAVVKCNDRCLYQSAKWAAELLNSLPQEDEDEADPDPDALDVDVDRTSHVPAAYAPNPDPEEAALEARELNKYLLAKTLFDCKEFDRCAAVFLPDSLLSGVLNGKSDTPHSTPVGKGKGKAARTSTQHRAPTLPALSQKSLFLALYAKFMSGEKAKNEQSEMVMGPQDLGTVTNKQLLVVGRYLSAWFEARTTEEGEVIGSQGWLEYLYGMVLAKEKNDDKALDFFIRSVHKYTMNWGCWLEITALVSRVEDLDRISRHCPENIVSYMFHLNTSLELYQTSAALSNSLAQLITIFPTSGFLLTCDALLAYHSKDFLTAELNFSRLLSLHPHRLDSLDHYSNILYVLNLRPKLAFLAHLCSNVDKFRPESCVVIGNYYSLISSHEKAVQYFRRALTLDRSCLSAWTLMGHEYLELKNTHAAIESYRRAVDVNRRDYRAWYGLGQTYEMLEMNTYALFYYKKAAGLRPWDGKMWMAVGQCLSKRGRAMDAIKALKRALLSEAYYDTGSSPGSAEMLGVRNATGLMDPEILLQIAQLYDDLGDEAEAKSYHELCLAQEVGGAAAVAAEGQLAESLRVHQDSDDDGDDGDRLVQQQQESGEGGGGTGVTIATSKARMWLAKYAMRACDYNTANRLATELCQDGQEVEDAKALVREIRALLGAMSQPGSDS